MWPKIYSLNISQPLTNISNDNKTNTFLTSTAKMLNQKQMLHFEEQSIAYKQQNYFQIKEYYQLIHKQNNFKTRWLCFSE